MITRFLLTVPVFAIFMLLQPEGGNNPQNIVTVSQNQDTIKNYFDGTFTGSSRDRYTDEPYWGRAEVKIEKGKITDIKFSIRDSAKHETFSAGYERHFATIPEYVEQCRQDLKGVLSYPAKLLREGKISKVDAISGATWSYNIFKASVNEALKKAEVRK